MEEVEVVEIHCYYFFFREMAFELYGDYPFYWFLHQALESAVGLFGINLLG